MPVASTLRDYITSIVPSWLSRPKAKGLLASLGEEGDALLEEALQALEYGRIEQGAADGLGPHARNSSLTRGKGESDSALRTYLRRRWLTHAESGGVPSMQLQVQRVLGSANAEIWTQLDLQLAGIPSAFGGYQGFWFLLLRQPSAFTVGPNWNGGALYNDGSLWGLGGVPRAELEDLFGALRKWKPATTSCRFVVVELDGAQPLTVVAAASWAVLGPRPLGSLTTIRGIHGLRWDWQWAVGSVGRAARWNGYSWTSKDTGQNSDLYGVWSYDQAGLDRVVTVGGSGKILRWDGGTWAQESSGLTTTLRGVWGSSASDQWAVGAGGKILHWNGAAWSSVASGTTNDLYAVWGSSATDVWAVGATGKILRWNGTSWSTVASGVTNDLQGLWGSSASDVWAVGTGGRILHWNGTAWSTATSGTTDDLYGVWAAGPSEAWAVGGMGAGIIRKWNGTSWSGDTVPAVGTLFCAWGAGSKEVWAGDSQGDLLALRSSGFGAQPKVILPVGELWEIDPRTNSKQEFFHLSYLKERV